MIKKVILTTVFLITITVLYAQDKLSEHKDFFQNKSEELKSWLDTNNLNSILEFDTLTVDNDKVHIMFKAKDKHNWDRLDSTIQVTKNKSLSTLLLKKCVFLMDLDFFQCELEIETIDYFIYISFLNNEINTEFQQKMGEISDNIDIEIGDINGLTKKGKTNSKYTIEEIKTKLDNSLKSHYEKFEHWWADYEYKSFGIQNNNIVIISNIKGPILKGSYFEKIIIEFEFEINEQSVNVNYDWQAKFGSGIFTVYETDYKDMELKYGSKMKEYNAELKSIINNAIKK